MAHISCKQEADKAWHHDAHRDDDACLPEKGTRSATWGAPKAIDFACKCDGVQTTLAPGTRIRYPQRIGDKLPETTMTHADYRTESLHSIVGPLLPDSRLSMYLVSDGSAAVVMAEKCVTIPGGGEIRVVYIPTGELIFRKSTPPSLSPGEDG